MRKNVIEPDRLQKTIRHMRIACWIPKATNTHTEYTILIAVPLQQWLLERASMLRCSTPHVLFVLCREEGQLEVTRRRFSEISPYSVWV
jgi:hypothetical protein